MTGNTKTTPEITQIKAEIIIISPKNIKIKAEFTVTQCATRQ